MTNYPDSEISSFFFKFLNCFKNSANIFYIINKIGDNQYFNTGVFYLFGLREDNDVWNYNFIFVADAATVHFLQQKIGYADQAFASRHEVFRNMLFEKTGIMKFSACITRPLLSNI